MKPRIWFLLLSSFIPGVGPPVRATVPPQKDYLTSVEADKIRDAENNTNERIRLFLSFADDRLKKFQYELEHPSTNRHTDMLNSLLNAYVGCVDDAIEGTRDAMNDAEKAKKKVAPPPIRRKN